MRTMAGCCFGHPPVDFRHISTTHVNNCTKVNTSVSTTDLMRVINITLFSWELLILPIIVILWFRWRGWSKNIWLSGSQALQRCRSQRRKLVKFVNVRNSYTPSNHKIGCRVISKNRHNDNLVEKQTRAKIKP